MNALAGRPEAVKTRLLLGWGALLAAVLIALPQIPQPAAYHGFADRRVLLGIPNFGDVVSNLGFLLAGLAGLWSVLFGRARAAFRERWHAWPYVVFFAGVTSVGFGSAYYHWAPSDPTLVWDRATMTLAFMSLFGAVIADRVDLKRGARSLPALLLIGLASVGWWAWTGDVTAYLVASQIWPLSSILLIVFLLYPTKDGVVRYVDGRWVAAIALTYGAAVAFEQLDHVVFAWTRGIVSGHSLKHLAAALSVWLVLPMLLRGTRES